MDEVAAADVHADVVGVIAVAEEDKVADLQIAAGNVGALAHLVVGHAVHLVAVLRQHIIHEAGAVKAGRRALAAPDVAVADEGHREVRDLARRAGAGDGAAAISGAAARGDGAVLLVGEQVGADVGGDALILDSVPLVAVGGGGRDAGDGDGGVVAQLADLRAAGGPGVADVDGAGLADIHGLADAGDRDVQVDLVNDDRRALDVFIVEPLDGLVAAQEHRHRFLPAGVALGVQIGAAAERRALYIGVAHADLRGFLRPGRDLVRVGKAVQRAVRSRGGEGRRGAEVLDQLEKLLPCQQLVRAERAVFIAVDNAVEMGLDDVFVVRVGEAREALVRQVDVVARRLFKGVHGQLAHLAAGDVLGEVEAIERGGHQPELVDLVVVRLEPAAVFVVRSETDRAHRHEHRRAQQQAEQFSYLLHLL